MSNLTTLPKGDSAWLLRRSIQRIMQQVSVLETNIGTSTTGNSANTQVIFNDNGTLRGAAGFTYNAATDTLSVDSATITGNLTVDTNTLFVDSVNDVVLIGSATKATYGGNKLEVRGLNLASLGATNVGNLAILTTDSQAIDKGGTLALGGGFDTTTPYAFAVIAGRKETSTNANAQGYLQFLTTNSGNAILERYRISGDGVATWSNVGGVAGTAMTLNSTGLGVGVVPASLAGLGSTFRQKGVGAAGGIFTENSTGASWFGIYSGTSLADSAALIYPSGGTLRFATTTGVGVGGFATQMTLDASGRLLVGSTSAFTDLTGSKEVKVGDSGMQTLTVASLPASTATNIARGGVGGLVYVGGFNGTGQYGAVVLWTAASATVVSVINGTGSTITFAVSGGFLQITSSLVLTQVTASCIRI